MGVVRLHHRQRNLKPYPGVRERETRGRLKGLVRAQTPERGRPNIEENGNENLDIQTRTSRSVLRGSLL